MKYYIAKLIFEIEVLNEKRKIQYEEKLVCVKGPDTASAYKKATTLAKQHETAFINGNHHHIQWKLLGITNLFPLNRFEENLELYSEIKEDGEIDASMLVKRADFILKRFAGQTE
jgi:hypothetical protein